MNFAIIFLLVGMDNFMYLKNTNFLGISIILRSVAYLFTTVDVREMKIDLIHLRIVKKHVHLHSYKTMFANSKKKKVPVGIMWKGSHLK